MNKVLINIERYIEGLAAKGQSSGDMGIDLGRCFADYAERLSKFRGIVSEDGTPSVDMYRGALVKEDVSVVEKVRKAWNSQAPTWMAVETAHTYAFVMGTLMKHFRINDRVSKDLIVSLGCGPGLYEIFLAAAAYNYGMGNRVEFHGLDFAPQMIEVAKESVGVTRVRAGKWELPLKNIRFDVGDMSDLSCYHDHSVGQILINNSLQWVPQWRGVLDEVQRVINPNGLGILQVVFHPYDMKLNHNSEISRIDSFTKEQLFDELEARQFMVTEVRDIAGATGTGQFGRSMNRVYVKADWTSKKFEPWRSRIMGPEELTVFTGSHKQV